MLLIANYVNDRQESMQRFAAMLEAGLKKAGIAVEVIRPEPFFGKLKRGAMGLGKWLGYLDKFVLFPKQLRKKIAEMGEETVVHICDHSNAFYTRHLADTPHLVTCNDLLAVRSALGEFPENRTGFMGRILQRWILNGLKRAQRITCISEATRKDVLRLVGSDPAKVDVTYMGLDPKWSPMPAVATEAQLRTMPGVSKPYILHVGGGQWYKNRPGVLFVYKSLMADWPNVKLVMVGPVIEGEKDVVFLERVSDEQLRALYSGAELLFFPSLEEGFGWPIVEAQACGCLVVATGAPAMWEAGGGDYFNLPDPRSRGWNMSTKNLISILLRDNEKFRNDRPGSPVIKGLENAKRFSTETMVQRYVAVYRELLYKV